MAESRETLSAGSPLNEDAPSPVLLGLRLTWTPVAPLHPDVTVALGDSGLRVQEGQAHAALGTETGIVIVALLHGIFVVLLPEAAVQTTIRWVSVSGVCTGHKALNYPSPFPPASPEGSRGWETLALVPSASISASGDTKPLR